MRYCNLFINYLVPVTIVPSSTLIYNPFYRPLLKSYIEAIDEQLEMVSPLVEELRFQHSVTPLLGLSFGVICSVVMLLTYLV